MLNTKLAQPDDDELSMKSISDSPAGFPVKLTATSFASLREAREFLASLVVEVMNRFDDGIPENIDVYSRLLGQWSDAFAALQALKGPWGPTDRRSVALLQFYYLY